MKLKLSTINNSLVALKEIAGQEFPINIAYRIQKNIRKLDSEDVIHYKKELRRILFEKYKCEEKRPGEFFPANLKDLDACNKEVKALGDEEIEIDIMLIPMDAIPRITPMNFMLLEWMFEEPTTAGSEVPKSPSSKRKR